MNTLDLLIKDLHNRVDSLKNNRAMLLEAQNSLSPELAGQMKPLISEVNARIHEIDLVLRAIENHQEKPAPGPKVVGKIELGNIEQCFQEDMIREIEEQEEDYFDGY
jgi:hypothetical protein